MNGKETGKAFGEAQRQPSDESKRQGWAKKKFKRELIKEFLNTKFTFPKNSKIAKELIAAFGEDVTECDAGTIATLRQIQNVIDFGNPIAFEKLMNQAYGQPKQEIEHSGEIQGASINNIIIENPNQGNKNKADPSAV